MLRLLQVTTGSPVYVIPPQWEYIYNPKRLIALATWFIQQNTINLSTLAHLFQDIILTHIINSLAGVSQRKEFDLKLLNDHPN
jgi:hypothetical protein